MPDQQTNPDIIEHEKQTIRQIVGLSPADNIHLNESGWDSRVYSFNDDRYFFKFPRSSKIQGRYKYEISAIKFVKNLTTDILCQKILWEHPDNAYFGYEGINGRPLSMVINDLTDTDKQNIGSMLGAFLKDFHELALPGARTMSIEDESAQIQRWYEQHQQAISKFFSAAERAKLQTLVYDAWPTRLRELGSDSVLSHGDLHFENILYGQDGSVGVIDFGDVGYYDRSKDFLELDEDKSLFEGVTKAYGDFRPNLKQKISVRQDMIQIINFGFYAGKGNEAKAKETADRIRSIL